MLLTCYENHLIAYMDVEAVEAWQQMTVKGSSTTQGSTVRSALTDMFLMVSGYLGY